MNAMIARGICISAMTVCLVSCGHIPSGFSADQAKGTTGSQSSSAAFDPANQGDRLGDEGGKIMKEMMLEELTDSSSQNRRNSTRQTQERMANLMEQVKRSLANASTNDLRTFYVHFYGHSTSHVESMLEDIRKQLATESNAQRKQQLRNVEDKYARNLQDLKTELEDYQAQGKRFGAAHSHRASYAERHFR